MAELKPFTINVTATLKIGEMETHKTIKVTLPVSMKFDSKRESTATISVDQSGFLRHIEALTDWFEDFPAEPSDG